MKKTTVCFAAFAVLCLLAGMSVAFVFAWNAGLVSAVFCIVGILSSFIFAPAIHEWGHITLAKTQKMRLVYTKFFCFKIAEKNGKLRFSFASPFLAEQTQTLPVCGGNMKKRAKKYTAGGLLFGGASFLIFAASATVLALLDKSAAFFFFGLLPYTGYLFLLNAAPLYFAGGKTDALILKGLKNDSDEEKVMISAMEIFGELSEGKSFSQIDEKYYFDLPVIAESLPVYATITDLRYRYKLEKGDFDGAADEINRLAQSSEYMDGNGVEEVAAELAYMHTVFGDIERAKQARKLCENYLSSDLPAAKRINAAFFVLTGQTDKAEEERNSFERVLPFERIDGKRKAEQVLMAREADGRAVKR